MLSIRRWTAAISRTACATRCGRSVTAASSVQHVGRLIPGPVLPELVAQAQSLQHVEHLDQRVRRSAGSIADPAAARSRSVVGSTADPTLSAAQRAMLTTGSNRVRLDVEVSGRRAGDAIADAELGPARQRLLQQQPHRARMLAQVGEDAVHRGQARVAVDRPAVHQQRGHDRAVVLDRGGHPVPGGGPPLGVGPGEQGATAPWRRARRALRPARGQHAGTTSANAAR